MAGLFADSSPPSSHNSLPAFECAHVFGRKGEKLALPALVSESSVPEHLHSKGIICLYGVNGLRWDWNLDRQFTASTPRRIRVPNFVVTISLHQVDEYDGNATTGDMKSLHLMLTSTLLCAPI
jgi:hypothetical protein